MSDVFNEQQRQFLQLLGLAVPGDLPSELAASIQPTPLTPSEQKFRLPAQESHTNTLQKPVEPSSTDLVAPVASATLLESEKTTAPMPELAEATIDPQRLIRISTLDWRDLQIMVHDCQACPLGQTRQHTVFGAGNPRGTWLFVGEAPGAEEDRRGEAFVGRGGQLLDNMLKAMGLSREREVYIANILKCRPPNNRDPLGPEVHACVPFLQRQIALQQPRMIVALGRFAAQGLLQVNTPLSQLRGNTHLYQDIPLVVTYHPAYLLRSPLEKRKVWEDLKLAMRVFANL
ncbi:MAG: uracil-DNA glycosylase [Acidithiobacillus sp.]